MKKTLSQKFYRIALWWFKYWSHVYRFFFNRKYNKVQLQTNMFPDDVAAKLQRLVYTPDGGKQLWDACSSPKWVQHCINSYHPSKQQPAGPMDCDEFAIWSANAMAEINKPHVLTVAYIKPGGVLGGHALCVYQDGKYLDGTPKLYHTGNWGKTGPYADLGTAVVDIVKTVEGDLVAWGLLDKNLSHKAHGTTYPHKKIL